MSIMVMEVINFNSIKVRLELASIFIDAEQNRHFNSIKVRLEPGGGVAGGDEFRISIP